MKSTLELNTQSSRQTSYDELMMQVKALTETVSNLQSIIANQQSRQSRQTNWRELKDKRERVKASIDRFIEQIPNLTDDEIETYTNQYISELSDGCFDNVQYQQAAISDFQDRVIKARQGNKPPQYQIDQLPPPSQICPFDNIVLYTQIANHNLTNDSLKAEYMSRIPQYTKWYIRDLHSNYLPSLLECIRATKRPDFTEQQTIQVINSIWNQNCPNFKI